MAAVPGGRSVHVRVPASTANLGPGFDSIGLALGLWDEYTVTTRDEPGLSIDVAGHGADEVPTDESHLVHATIQYTWRELGYEPPAGLGLVAGNGVPHGRGLGSSATAIVAGVVAAQALSMLDLPGRGDPVELDLAAAGHLASVLEGHPDNASASVYGGLTVSWMPDLSGRDRAERTVTARPVLHPEIEVVVLVPDAQLATRTARAVLPREVPLASAAANAGRAALLVHALTAEPGFLHGATRDWLHQEARRASYPASMALVDALRSDGHAAVISGAGPSVLVLTTRSARDAVTLPPQWFDWHRLTPGVPVVGAQVTAC
ncbi:MAG: homoserine kinase [Intrasporangium sp.]|uniref:homoserine kinase n=1 Tax=Intrasporangium sp. TaxID=1925024 RepID=UPI0026472035|nr:homoserine kinase [Intrasporangium sp.]MDN5796167.1 homoserine kinase [Intrasporangium sp.]